MASRRKNGEGSWGTKKIHGDEYVYYRNIDGKCIRIFDRDKHDAVMKLNQI